ncbi:hypothetical protein EJ03DRAFT_104587 [Teratosphaeria nubilosa]|uniref:Uncharacterized protein n=1 Tax=Teratosphaeria nubilosa TaxID=161662 RepID=A0A6G1LMN9_9PEZI|nr:hypothetical protein EJ03DRAFT_104587 [Teratosphaeria nubilosa]
MPTISPAAKAPSSADAAASTRPIARFTVVTAMAVFFSPGRSRMQGAVSMALLRSCGRQRVVMRRIWWRGEGDRVSSTTAESSTSSSISAATGMRSTDREAQTGRSRRAQVKLARRIASIPSTAPGDIPAPAPAMAQQRTPETSPRNLYKAASSDPSCCPPLTLPSPPHTACAAVNET